MTPIRGGRSRRLPPDPAETAGRRRAAHFAAAALILLAGCTVGVAATHPSGTSSTHGHAAAHSDPVDHAAADPIAPATASTTSGAAQGAGTLTADPPSTAVGPTTAFTPESSDAHHSHTTAGPAADPSPRSVTDLSGPRDVEPDVRIVLTARTAAVTLDSGRVVQAWTYDGSIPGPTLHLVAGRLVEVVLRNADVADGVTIHWHGLDVPNAEDGVAGITQDAVFPGGEHVYRFVPDQVGTFWYHSHQNAAEGVARGLFGALIVHPAGTGSATTTDEDTITAPVADGTRIETGPAGGDLTLLAHTWTDPARSPEEERTVAGSTGVTRHEVAVGQPVRARLINADFLPQDWSVTGSPFVVSAIDGVEVNAPTPVDGERVRVAAGGRFDVSLTMPDHPVLVQVDGLNRPGVLLVPPGSTAPVPEPASNAGDFDPLDYGSPTATPFSGQTPADVQAEQILDTRRARRNGLPFTYWTINGAVYPDIPPITVEEGDLVRVHIRNDGTDIHPMHLHGHHALVVERNGVPASGSPWWVDTLDIDPGDDVVLLFRADNPGLWMDHCHNLDHAAAGMVMHLEYAGVHTPYEHGGNSPNRPE